MPLKAPELRERPSKGIGRVGPAPVRVRAAAFSVPGSAVTTDELLHALRGRISDELEQTLRRLGVRTRFSVLTDLPGYVRGSRPREMISSTTTLAVDATRRCLANAGGDARDVELLIAITNTGDRPLPCLAYEIVARLPGTLRRDVNVLNLQGQGCSVLLKAVAIARDFIAAHPGSRVLVASAEAHTAYVGPLDAPLYLGFREIARSPDRAEREARQLDTQRLLGAVLFGDAAVAFLLDGDAGDGFRFGPVAHATNLDGRDPELLTLNQGGAREPAFEGFPAYVMGERVPARGVAYAAEVLGRLRDAPGVGAGDVDPAALDFCLVHTGSRKILDAVCGRLGLDPGSDKVRDAFDVLATYGNTSSCSIGLMIARRLAFGEGGRGLMLSFGVGFSASAGTGFHG